ncbi:MAG: GNAT family N-acetyltransferase [Candidatus Dormibacteria bacterium]
MKRFRAGDAETPDRQFLPVTVRSYRDRVDLHAMQDLVQDEWRTAKPLVQTHIGDLSWWKVSYSDRNEAWAVRLWTHMDGALLGWAWYTAPDSLDMFFRPDLRGSRLHEQAVLWFLHTAAAAQGSRRVLARAWALDRDQATLELLLRLGFERGGVGFEHMVRDLTQPIEVPHVEGFTVRATRPDEIEARVAVHRAAYAPSKYNADKHWRLRASRGYHPELDVVAVSDRGDFGAFALSWLDEVNAVGELEPVGTDPLFRRRGLARAAVMENLRRLRDLGADTAVVYAISNSTDAIRLYEGCGFVSRAHHLRLTRPLHP